MSLEELLAAGVTTVGEDVPTDRTSCEHCGTSFRTRGSTFEFGALEKHRARCAGESPEARAFYSQHRRWPKRRGKQMEEAPEEKGSDTDSWCTPPALFEAASQRHGPFQLDAAATHENALCATYFTREVNALRQAWRGSIPTPGNDDIKVQVQRVWLNPPYSQPNLDRFMAKARAEAELGARVTCLVPATPDSGWFQEHVFRGADVMDKGTIHHGPLKGTWLRFTAADCDIELLFLRGRVRFLMDGEKRGTPTAGTAVITFAPRGTM